MKRLTGLWRQPDFLRLWAGQTISEFGSMLGAITLLAILTLEASPAQIGFLETAKAIPALLFGLFAGVWVDRRRRRPLLIGADIGRFLLLTAVAWLAWVGWLGMEGLYLAAFLVGSLTILFNIAYRSYLPSLVRREQLLEANSKLSATESLAEIGAPGIGGLLVQVTSTIFAILLDGVTYLLSAVALWGIKTEEPAAKPGEKGRLRADIAAGLRFVWEQRSLRALALAAATRNFFGGFFAALYALFVLRELGLTPALLGILIGAGGVGALFGALLVGRVSRRWGLGKTLIGTLLFMGLVSWLVPLAGFLETTAATAALLLGQLFNDAALAIYFIADVSLRQILTPDHLLGRMNASFEFVTGGIGTLGIFCGGLLGQWLGLQPAFVVAVSGIMLASLWLIFSPFAGWGRISRRNVIQSGERELRRQKSCLLSRLIS